MLVYMRLPNASRKSSTLCIAPYQSKVLQRYASSKSIPRYVNFYNIATPNCTLPMTRANSATGLRMDWRGNPFLLEPAFVMLF